MGQTLSLRWLLWVAVVGLAACGGGTVRDSSGERLDVSSAVTLRTDAEPLVFARAEARYSRSARDYLYLGPVETNRQGTYEYYLWVGVASTLDRGYLAPLVEAPEKLYADVQGEVMEFVLEPWAVREPALASVSLYRTAVPVREQLAARVTLDQLRLLAGADLSAVRVSGASDDTRLYSRWNSQAWSRFFEEIARAGR